MSSPAPTTNGTGRKRKRLPRSFDRRPKNWLKQFLDLDDVAGERMLNVRRDVLNLSRADASRLLRVARNTIWDWETGYRRAPFSAYLALRLIAESVRRESTADPWRRLPASSNVVPMSRHRLSNAASALPTEVPAQSLADLAREARRASRRMYKRGGLQPLAVNPETGKRVKNTGRYPTTGIYSPVLPAQPSPSRAAPDGRFRSRRERANELRSRMQAFSPIYNAGWLVRDAYFGSDDRRLERVMDFIDVLLQMMRQTEDHEALLFAVADALYASPAGVPWEA